MYLCNLSYFILFCFPYTSWLLLYRWEGKVYWGVSYGGVSIHNLPPSAPGPPGTSLPVLVLSSSEDPALHTRLSCRFSVLHATGAGYKQLVVALGLAAASVSSKVTCLPASGIDRMG